MPPEAGARRLTVRDLRVVAARPQGGFATLVEGVGFTVDAGQVVCLVGQSGCGKTATVRAVTAVLDARPGVMGGQVLHHLADAPPVSMYPEALAAAPLDPEVRGALRVAHRARRFAEAQFAPLRGRAVFTIFQNSQTSLSPFHSVQASLLLAAGRGGRTPPRPERRAQCLAWLRAVGFERPESFLEKLPSELSGGEAKRVAIAQALAAGARLLIADEPTTGLDPTLRVTIRDLLGELKAQGLGVLLITHGLGLFHRLADTVHVMTQGRIVESADARTFFGGAGPSHPYSRRLLAAEAPEVAP